MYGSNRVQPSEYSCLYYSEYLYEYRRCMACSNIHANSNIPASPNIHKNPCLDRSLFLYRANKYSWIDCRIMFSAHRRLNWVIIVVLWLGFLGLCCWIKEQTDPHARLQLAGIYFPTTMQVSWSHSMMNSASRPRKQISSQFPQWYAHLSS